MNPRTDIPPIEPQDLYHGCRCVALSHVGRVRDENQDFMGYFRRPGDQLLVVADGMGGHSGGFEASRIAMDAVRQVYLEAESDAPAARILSDAIQRANLRVHEAAQAQPALAGMGSTVVLVLVRDLQAWVAHVGDSRAYLVRAGQALALTRDHSRVNRMIDVGMIRPEAAADHPMKNILERSLGSGPQVEPEVRPEPVPLYAQDALLLCSDGLWGLVQDAEIGGLVRGSALAAGITEGLELALARGGHDNVTVGVLLVEEGPAPPAPPPPEEHVTTHVIPARTWQGWWLDALCLTLAVALLTAAAWMVVHVGSTVLRLHPDGERTPAASGLEGPPRP